MSKTEQGELFASAAPEAARPRLSRQCVAILARLRSGPATNRELSAIALKYTGRLSEIRQAGFDVVCVSQDHETGLATYQLKP